MALRIRQVPCYLTRRGRDLRSLLTASTIPSINASSPESSKPEEGTPLPNQIAEWSSAQRGIFNWPRRIRRIPKRSIPLYRPSQLDHPTIDLLLHLSDHLLRSLSSFPGKANRYPPVPLPLSPTPPSPEIRIRNPHSRYASGLASRRFSFRDVFIFFFTLLLLMRRELHASRRPISCIWPSALTVDDGSTWLPDFLTLVRHFKIQYLRSPHQF